MVEPLRRGRRLHREHVGVRLDWFDGQNLSAERLITQERALAPTALTGRFELPVFVIQGAEDFTTPTSLAKGFVDSVAATPQVDLTPPKPVRANDEPCWHTVHTQHRMPLLAVSLPQG
jgi:hypothetical protein